MHRRLLSISIVGLVMLGMPAVAKASATHSGVARQAAEARVAWGTPEAIPGLANLSDNTIMTDLVCPSAGNCVAGGTYQYTGNPTDNWSSFIVNEVNGTWQHAEEIPGLAELMGAGGDASVWSIACSAAGDCSAVGNYFTENFTSEGGFVADEVNGVWQPALEMPGLAALATGGAAEPLTVSCGAPGYCLAGGTAVLSGTSDSTQVDTAFFAQEIAGVWQGATTVPGLGALNVVGPVGTLYSCTQAPTICLIDCPTALNCTALGSFRNSKGEPQTFSITEQNGTWLAPTTSTADPFLLSCTTGGSCSSIDSGESVVTTRAGIWQPPTALPGLARLGIGDSGNINALACPQTGDCVAVGGYARHEQRGTTGSPSDFNAFVADESNGIWHRATPLPESYQNSNSLNLVACASAGKCVAIGGDEVAVEARGHWSAPRHLPGLARFRDWSGVPVVLACTTSAVCTLLGQLNRNESLVSLGFVDSWTL